MSRTTGRIVFCVLLVGFTGAVFRLGMLYERALTPDCVEKDVPTSFEVRIQIEALEHAVEHLDETLAYERGRLDETRQRMQVHREDAIRCCEVRRPVR